MVEWVHLNSKTYPSYLYWCGTTEVVLFVKMKNIHRTIFTGSNSSDFQRGQQIIQVDSDTVYWRVRNLRDWTWTWALVGWRSITSDPIKTFIYMRINKETVKSIKWIQKTNVSPSCFPSLTWFSCGSTGALFVITSLFSHLLANKFIQSHSIYKAFHLCAAAT